MHMYKFIHNINVLDICIYMSVYRYDMINDMLRFMALELYIYICMYVNVYKYIYTYYLYYEIRNCSKYMRVYINIFILFVL